MEKILDKNHHGDVFSGFLYLLRYSSCEITWKYEFTVIDYLYHPAVAWSFDEKYAYMLGYSRRDNVSERLFVIKDPYIQQSTDLDGDPDQWVLRTNI